MSQSRSSSNPHPNQEVFAGSVACSRSRRALQLQLLSGPEAGGSSGSQRPVCPFPSRGRASCFPGRIPRIPHSTKSALMALYPPSPSCPRVHLSPPSSLAKEGGCGKLDGHCLESGSYVKEQVGPPRCPHGQHLTAPTPLLFPYL